MDIAVAIAEGMAEELKAHPRYSHLVRVNDYHDLAAEHTGFHYPNSFVVGSLAIEGKTTRVYVHGDAGVAVVQPRDSFDSGAVFELDDPGFPDCLYRHLADALCPAPKVLLC